MFRFNSSVSSVLRLISVAVIGIPWTCTSGQIQIATASHAVVGTGEANVSVSPQLLRVAIPMQTEGKSLESAAEEMKDSLEAVQLELTSMGAVAKSFRTSHLKVDDKLGAQYDRLRRQMMSYGSGLSKAPKKPSKDKGIVRVKQYLIADFELTETGVELLARTVELKAKLEKIDLGQPAKEDLSPEEAEMLVEAQMFSDDEDSPQGPQLFYIASITLDQKKELYEQARKKAKEDAGELAALVGKQLGDVLMIQSSDGSSPFDRYEFSRDYGGGYGRGETVSQEVILPRSRKKLLKASSDSEPQNFTIALQLGYEFKKQ